MTYQGKIFAGGKIVIPAKLRRELGLHEGDTVSMESRNGAVVLKSRAQSLQDIRKAVKKGLKKPVSVAQFLAEKRAEAANE